MAPSEPTQSRLGPLVYFSNNWISILGILLTTTGGVAWLFTLPQQLSGANENPYLGMLTAFLLPIVFLLGLALIPLGIRLQERKARRQGLYPETFPEPRWSNQRFRQIVAFIGIATIANVVIGGHLTYSAVEEMDSVSFCGQACHIMGPEFTAFQHAPHSQLTCVDCHIGEGAESYIAAKLNGAKQLIEVITKTYPTPVPTPVHNLAQGALTCSNCHANQDFGTSRREWIRFNEDEANSAARTELVLAVGGGDNPLGAHGAHLSGDAVIEYRSDPSRETIPWIKYTSPDGETVEYATEDWEPARAEEFELRTMDCVDCHNRAAHSFENPADALDRAMASGAVDPALPFVKREGLELLTADYADREIAGERIREGLTEFYRADYPEVARAQADQVEHAGLALEAIYLRNIFPEWGVEWGTHPNQAGHTTTPGCFRCHDREHRSLDGKNRAIGQRCSSCHEMRAVEQPISAPSVPLLTESQGAREAVPAAFTFSTSLGQVDFDHSEHVDMANGDCTACHNRLFDMSRGNPGFGGGDGHAAAVEAKASCAGCHVSGGEAFATETSCSRCHSNLSAPAVRIASAPASSGPSSLPGKVEYDTSLGQAVFDHAAHVDLVDGQCSSCHSQLFPMASGPLNYGEDLHRAAEAAKSSCAGCHVAGGSAFASAGNCSSCHVGLGETRPTPVTGNSGLPEGESVATRLGEALFGHDKHVELLGGRCQTCHVRLFPLEPGMAGYADDLHRTAEQAKTSCGSCHRSGGPAFASQDNCLRCHVDLSASAAGSTMGLPAVVVYENDLADVPFDHDQHVREASGDCRSCHNQPFPMAKATLDYDVEDYHRGAERDQTSCASCHHPGGESFGALDNCTRCHQTLELPQRAPNTASIGWLALLLVFAVPVMGQAPGAGFIGSKRCAVCHAEQTKTFAQNPHAAVARIARLASPETECEACHGPGLAHVEALATEPLNNFARDQPAQLNRACLECHGGDDGFENHRSDEHARAGVACSSCHRMHSGVEGEPLLSASTNQLCSSCHLEERAEFNRPFGHELTAGAMECVDCHNPHGQPPGAATARVFATDTSCVRCHADKRGPFPFEHAPVRLEACSSCHEPHGSVNPRMLARHNVGQLCLECHSMTDGTLGGAPPSFHDPRTARFQSCTGCHSKIHGSFVDRDFLR